MERTNQKYDLAARVAIRYYEQQQSQNEIAGALGISRSYVSQLLTYARNVGIVKITLDIKSDYRREIGFIKHYGCKHAYIMDSDSPDFTNGNLGRFAAQHLSRLISNADVIGINLGEAVQKAVQELDSNDFDDASGKIVVQMMGGYNSDITLQASRPNELVNSLSTLLKCRSLYMNCPAIFENISLRNLILNENSIQEVTSYWKKIDMALMGIGVTDGSSKTFTLLSEEMKSSIQKSGAVCDININYFDSSGKHLNLIEENKVAVPYDVLKRIKNKVVIGYGAHKAKAILSALKAGMIDVLITDSITANAIEQLRDEEN